MIPKHPPGPPMTLGNMRELGPLSGSQTSPRPRQRSAPGGVSASRDGGRDV